MKFAFASERVTRLAAAFPDARLQILDGDSALPYLGNVNTVVQVIDRFVNGSGGEPDQDQDTPASDMTIPSLSSRERDVLKLLADGRSNQEIAGDLVLSVRTVERHLSNIYSKLGLSGKSARAGAAAFAASNRIA